MLTVPQLAEPNRNHYDPRPADTKIEHLVMHYTVCNFLQTMRLFTADVPSGRVSSHYVITQAEADVPAGAIIQVAPEHMRTWHAGTSYWAGSNNLNGSSIGIENVNQGYTQHKKPASEMATLDPAIWSTRTPTSWRWYPFHQQQIDSLGLLSQRIVKTYDIQPFNVVGHADIAPTRKQDPGILFPWKYLHEKYQVGAWLTDAELISARAHLSPDIAQHAPTTELMSTELSKYGYEITAAQNKSTDNTYSPSFMAVLNAFKSHFSGNGQPAYYNTPADSCDLIWISGLNHKKYNS